VDKSNSQELSLSDSQGAVEENEGDDTISEEEQLGEASKDEDMMESDEEDDGDEHSVETPKVKKQSLMQNFL
jgi:hypothetical protein